MKKYEGVLKRVREVEAKRGIYYAKTDGKLYKTLKILYTVILVWSFLMNTFTALGFMMRYSYAPTTEIRNIIITISAATVVLILGYIFNCVKFYLAGAISSIASIVVIMALVTNIFKDSLGLMGLAVPVYWRYIAPLTIIFILVVWMTIIAIRAQKKTDNMYKKVLENLFDEQTAKNDDCKPISEEDWDAFLESYNTNEE